MYYASLLRLCRCSLLALSFRWCAMAPGSSIYIVLQDVTRLIPHLPSLIAIPTCLLLLYLLVVESFQVVSFVDEDPALRQLATKEADNLVAGLHQWLNNSSSSSSSPSSPQCGGVGDQAKGNKGGDSGGVGPTEHASSRTSPRLSLSDARKPSLWETAAASGAAAADPSTAALAASQQLADQGENQAAGTGAQEGGQRVATTPRAAAARLMRALALRLAAPSVVEKEKWSYKWGCYRN